MEDFSHIQFRGMKARDGFDFTAPMSHGQGNQPEVPVQAVSGTLTEITPEFLRTFGFRP